MEERKKRVIGGVEISETYTHTHTTLHQRFIFFNTQEKDGINNGKISSFFLFKVKNHIDVGSYVHDILELQPIKNSIYGYSHSKKLS